MTIQRLRWNGRSWDIISGGGAAPAPTGRSQLVSGTYKPDATTTGLLPGWTRSMLTPVSGNQTHTTSNITYSNKLFTGRVFPRATGIVYSNCMFVGGGATVNSALADCNDSASRGTVFQDCLFVPDTPSIYLDGIIGHDYTALRCNVYNTVDGFGAYNSGNSNGAANVLIQQSYVHDLYYFSPDPNHPADNRTHNDGVQIQGNSNISLRGNAIEAFASSVVGNAFPGASPAPPSPDPYYPAVTGQAIGITPNVGPVTGILIEDNWLDGGANTVTIILGKYPASNVGVIRNNTFGRNSGRNRSLVIDPTDTVANMPSSTGPDHAGNVYEDTGTPITVIRATS